MPFPASSQHQGRLCVQHLNYVVSPLVLRARLAERGKWNGHINRSWPGAMEILTLPTSVHMKSHFLQPFVLQSRKNRLRKVLEPALFTQMASGGT